MLNCGISGTGATRRQIDGEPMEDIDMKTKWTEWIIPTAACMVFPVLIPLALLLVVAVSVSAAMKTTPGDEI